MFQDLKLGTGLAIRIFLSTWHLVHYFNLGLVLFKYTSSPVQLRHLMWYFGWGVCRSSCINLVNLPRSADKPGRYSVELFVCRWGERRECLLGCRVSSLDYWNPRLIRTYPSQTKTYLYSFIGKAFIVFAVSLYLQESEGTNVSFWIIYFRLPKAYNGAL